jgi:hypothetical protein
MCNLCSHQPLLSNEAHGLLLELERIGPSCLGLVGLLVLTYQAVRLSVTRSTQASPSKPRPPAMTRQCT